MKGHVFRHGGSENRDKCHKTIKAIIQHVAEECDGSQDIKKSIEKMKHAVTSLPTDTPDWDGATATERLTQKKLADNCVNHEARFKEHKIKTFESTLGQCVDALKNKIEATVGHEAVKDSDDVMESLK